MCGCITITSSSDLAGETTPTATYLTPINGSLQIICDLSSYTGMTTVDMNIVVTVTAANTNGDSQSYTFTITAFDCMLETQSLTTTPEALLMYISTSSSV